MKEIEPGKYLIRTHAEGQISWYIVGGALYWLRRLIIITFTISFFLYSLCNKLIFGYGGHIIVGCCLAILIVDWFLPKRRLSLDELAQYGVDTHAWNVRDKVLLYLMLAAFVTGYYGRPFLAKRSEGFRNWDCKFCDVHDCPHEPPTPKSAE
jgi:hypothetical protein